MILIGMFDSPFVRRVAVSMKLLGLGFEHRNWSVGKDQASIREFNPLGRVPTLVLDNGEVLLESSAILDHLDQEAGPEAALLPIAGPLRRRGLNLMALATGAAEKGIAQIYEVQFRPPEKRHEPWVQRCREQMQGALRLLDRACAEVAPGHWLLGKALSQADITVACMVTLLSDALRLAPGDYPALTALVARCEALPEFKSVHVPYFAPGTGPVKVH